MRTPVTGLSSQGSSTLVSRTDDHDYRGQKTGNGFLIIVVPIFVEPTFRNAVAVFMSVGLALAFALKGYGSSLVAGLVTVLENAYQPGDWIELGGIYGEVKSIELRATRIVTADDTEVIIPNSRTWTGSIANATSGHQSLLCVAEFYFHLNHDGMGVRTQLTQIAETSSYRKSETPISVIVMEKPWGTKCRLRAVREGEPRPVPLHHRFDGPRQRSSPGHWRPICASPLRSRGARLIRFDLSRLMPAANY